MAKMEIDLPRNRLEFASYESIAFDVAIESIFSFNKENVSIEKTSLFPRIIHRIYSYKPSYYDFVVTYAILVKKKKKTRSEREGRTKG